MRRIIAAFKTSIDGKVEGPEGFADWVDAWTEDYGLTPSIDACLLGGRMYPGYESYWGAMQKASDQPLPMTGRVPTEAELAWARFAEKTPHFVLSRNVTTAAWPGTRFLRHVDEVAALKGAPGKDIYLMGGAQLTASLVDAGLVDELRLIVYPLVAGKGKALFGTTERRRRFELRSVEQLDGGRLRLVYGT
jgi:dihydrofolate reductase